MGVSSKALAHISTIIVAGMIVAIAIGTIYIGTSVSGNPNFSSSLDSSGSASLSSSEHTFLDDYAITNDSSNYFPNGYYSYELNFTSAYYGGFDGLTNGQVINLADVKFTYHIPSGSTSFLTTINGENETEFEEIDYFCGSFFNVTMPSGSSFLLDYCTPHNDAVTAVTTTILTTTVTENPPGYTSYTLPIPWSMWEIKKNVSPAFGIHIAGNGNNVSLIELAVAKKSP